MTDEPAAGKHCTKCGVWKVLDEFHRNLSRIDSRGSRCKLCKTEYMEVYREASKNRILDYQRNYRLKNRDRIAEYREANRDRTADYDRKYREANRDKLHANKLARRARKAALPSETVLLREIALRDGATCWMCGDELSEWNPAHLDHLVPLSASVGLLEAWNLSNPGTVRANMALACPSCNIRKSNRVMPCALARYFRNLSAESEIAA